MARVTEGENCAFARPLIGVEASGCVLGVDVSADEDSIVASTAKSYPKVQAAGIGTANPHWLVIWNLRLKRFFGETMP